MVAGTLHPLTPEYYETRPPGAYGTYIFLVYGTVMFWFSLRESKKRADKAIVEDG